MTDLEKRLLEEARMTRKKFSVRCKEIASSPDHSRAEKLEIIHYLSTSLTEDTIHRTPEFRDWEKREAAAISKHAGHGGFSYCPHDGEWSPDSPAIIKALDQEYTRIFKQKVREAFQKALKMMALVEKAA